MINKGKGCITAIFNGSIPIGVIKHGLDTIFQKPTEPVEPSPIPGYTVLDSIYGDGNQYAVIDYYANQNTKVEIKFNYERISYNSYLFVSRTGFGNSGFGFMPEEVNAKFSRSFYGKAYREFGRVSDGEDHVMIQSTIYTYVDDVFKTYFEEETFTSKNPMYILNYADTPNTSMKAKIYYMKIWDDETLVHDLVPALNNETGVAGLYDMVTNEFITSKGEAGFTPIYTE
jgi:hypothetical protein